MQSAADDTKRARLYTFIICKQMCIMRRRLMSDESSFANDAAKAVVHREEEKMQIVKRRWRLKPRFHITVKDLFYRYKRHKLSYGRYRDSRSTGMLAVSPAETEAGSIPVIVAIQQHQDCTIYCLNWWKIQRAAAQTTCEQKPSEWS